MPAGVSTWFTGVTTRRAPTRPTFSSFPDGKRDRQPDVIRSKTATPNRVSDGQNMHWDHEPADRAGASWTAPVLWRFWLPRLHRQSARGLAHSKTWRGFQRFMESPL